MVIIKETTQLKLHKPSLITGFIFVTITANNDFNYCILCSLIYQPFSDGFSSSRQYVTVCEDDAGRNVSGTRHTSGKVIHMI